MKAQRVIHTTRGQERVAKCADKPSSHGKHMNNRQAMDTRGSGVCTRLRQHLLIPSQYRSGGPWVKGKKGYGLAVGRRGKLILGFPLKHFREKCSAGMTYHQKEGNVI